MANLRQSKKRARQSETRRIRNRSVRTRVRTSSKAVRTATTPVAVADAFRTAQSVIDRAAKRGVLHPRAAARRKSRLARLLQAQSPAK